MTGYYKGKGDAAGALQRMISTGRELAKQERNRWQMNRFMYRGEQWMRARPGSGFSSGRLELLMDSPRGRRRDTFNRLRQMTDGRVSMLTASRPPYEVVPRNRDQNTIDAARQATKLIASKWDEGGWNVGGAIRELVLNGEIDGVSFLHVYFDSNAGEVTYIPFSRETGKPVVSREEYEALEMEDPEGNSLWEYRPMKMGEVVWRVVRPGAISVDPSAAKWTDARWVMESRVFPRSIIEQQTGKKVDDILKQSSQSGAATTSGFNPRADVAAPVSLDDDGTANSNRIVPGRDEFLVHEAYIKPGGDWPKGCHIRWLDRAPGIPLMIEDFMESDLPYRPFNPKPDGGHFVRCRGTVDELRPIQQRFNRILSLLHEWLERVARPPLIVPVGAVRQQEIYNDKGLIEVHPIGDPHFMPTPSEPVAMLTQHLQWCISQMAEIANQSEALRGFSPGQGVESAIGIQTLAQNAETQLSGTAAQVATAVEWGLSRSLSLVAKYYVMPRLISAPGVDDANELRAFTGAQIKGAEDVRITASILPQSRAMQFQTLMQLAPIVGGDIRPYVARFMEGDYEEFIGAETAQRNRQKRENNALAALATLPQRDQIWTDFQGLQSKYMQAAQMAQAQGGDPIQTLAASGIQPPTVLELLRDAGVVIPSVEDFDDHAQHLRTLDDWRLADGFDAVHPLVRQAAREHAEQHKKMMTHTLMGIGQQMPPPDQQNPQGSQPAPKGQPSPPKQPGGTAPAANTMAIAGAN
jgi:hypothetical protein